MEIFTLAIGEMAPVMVLVKCHILMAQVMRGCGPMAVQMVKVGSQQNEKEPMMEHGKMAVTQINSNDYYLTGKKVVTAPSSYNSLPLAEGSGHAVDDWAG